MLPATLKLEQFSLAHIRAVVTGAGYQITVPETDVDSVDGILMSSRGQRPRIDFQAKATSQDLVKGDTIHFPLPLKNYNELRASSMVPRILIVVLVPANDDEWLSQTHSELCLHNCAYWLSLEGRDESSSTSTVTVQVPVANMFNRDTVHHLMTRAGDGVSL